MLNFLTALASITLAQVPAEPAKASLTLDQIIVGIEKDQALWRAQKSWLVRYSHTRERIDPAPGRLVSYGENQVVNARKGSWAFLSEDQSMVGDASGMSGRRTWGLWRDHVYTMRDHDSLFLQSDPPKEGNIFFNCWLYPMGLCRDSLADTLSIPEEAYTMPEGLWLELPRGLKSHRAEYRVRPSTEPVDEFPCHVLEWPGKDVIWLDDKHGFHVRRRRFFQPSGDVAAEIKASWFKEKVPGIWLPDRQISVAFNMDQDPKEYRGRVSFVMTNVLRESRFNDVPDSVFAVPTGKGLVVQDLRWPKR